MNKRIVGIDFLRGVAVILVIFRHITWPSIPFLTRIGWAGVDLFFVLSGYLVTSLLLVEYQKTSKVNIQRFLIRRAFKIYPAHYVMIIITIISFPIINIFFPIQIGYGAHPYIGEFFYLQNYIGALWNHTWSLAVEEHFYILLCIFVYIVIRTKLIEKGTVLVWIFALLLLLVLILRITHSYDTTSIAFLSHFRMDSLMFGSVIAYILSFRADQSTAFVRKHNKLLVFIAALLLMPILFLHPWSTFMLTYGLTFTYIGFGLLVVLIVVYADSAGMVKISQLVLVRQMANVGFYSYSIYLWHMFVIRFCSLLQKKLTFIHNSVFVILTFALAIAVGIVMAKLVELPALKLRDKITR